MTSDAASESTPAIRDQDSRSAEEAAQHPATVLPSGNGVAGDTAPIDGGEIVSPGNHGNVTPIQFGPEARHRADTARFLAYALVGVLGASFLLHYTAMHIAAYYGNEGVAEKMSTLFGAWLPVISSLVSAAVTYYFTREGGLGRSK